MHNHFTIYQFQSLHNVSDAVALRRLPCYAPVSCYVYGPVKNPLNFGVNFGVCVSQRWSCDDLIEVDEEIPPLTSQIEGINFGAECLGHRHRLGLSIVQQKALVDYQESTVLFQRKSGSWFCFTRSPDQSVPPA